MVHHCLRSLLRRFLFARLEFLLNSGYTMARMRYDTILAPEAVDDYKRLKANLRSTVRDAIELHLRHQPTKTSKSRIKRLRGMRKPQYRLRVEHVRIFYDVTGNTIEVLAIVEKSQAANWLERIGEAE